ncbi:hypothetical protein ACHWQZ_G000361 [Mnemiopsis leidyi]
MVFVSSRNVHELSRTSFSIVSCILSLKRLSALEGEEDYEKFLELIKTENSLTDVVLYNNNKLLDMEEDKLDCDLDLENYANDMI